MCVSGPLPVNDESSEETGEWIEGAGAEETDSRRGSKKIEIKETCQADMILAFAFVKPPFIIVN